MLSSDMKRPIAAVSAVPRSLDTGYGEDLGDTVAAGLVKGVRDAGGVPVMLPVVSPEEARIQLQCADCLVLAGGQDVDLELSDEEMALQPQPRWIDRARDLHEFALWDEAKRRNLPVLAICRGAQLVNHAEGGSLVAHIDGHDAGERHETERHTVRVEGGTELARAIGDLQPTVNTIHHQAARQPASGFRVSAVSPDGIIEALERNRGSDGNWLLAVQWHPELMLDDSAGQPLFDALIERAKPG